MKFTKQAESQIVALNNDATCIASKLRKVHTEMYVIDPDKGQMEMTLNNVEELLEIMGKDANKLIRNIKGLEEGKKEEGE